MYGILVMLNHGAIHVETKKMAPVDSSSEGEGIATAKCAPRWWSTCVRQRDAWAFSVTSRQ